METEPQTPPAAPVAPAEVFAPSLDQPVTMREMMEAGVHYGHQTKRWNPKMKPFIYGARNGVHIIDLQY